MQPLHALALLATLAPAPAPPDTVRTFTLANGVRVYMQRAHTHGATIVHGTVALSPAFDPAGKEGTGALAIAVLHAHSDATYTYGARFSATVATSRLAGALAALAAAERNAAVTPAALRAAAADETQLAAQRDADPATRAERAFDRAIYRRNDPLLRLETARSIAAVTPAGVRAYVQRYFVPQNTSLVIVGEFDPRTMRALVQRSFGTWPRAALRPSIALPAAAPPARSVSVIAGTGDTDRVRIGQATIGRLDRDFYALNLVNAVLAARLARTLPAAAATSALLTTRDRGVLAIDLAPAPATLNAARATAKAEVTRVIRTAIPAAEWNAARGRLLASRGLTDPSPAAAVARCENLAQNDLPPDYFARIGSYYAVTPAAGLRAARRALHADTFTEVIVTSAAPSSVAPPSPSP